MSSNNLVNKRNKSFSGSDSLVISSATLKGARGSVDKLKLIADSIKGKKIDDAFLLLEFSNKRSSSLFKSCLLSAVSNAKCKSNVDLESLYVSKILVGRDKYLKRFMPRGRGRSSRVLKIYSRFTIFISKCSV